MTQKDREALAVDVRNPKHAWGMLAAANTKIKISRLHSVCVATPDHRNFAETDCVNITVLNISHLRRKLQMFAAQTRDYHPSLKMYMYICM